MKLRIRLDLAYVGTRYLGWQRQPAGPSIQETLESTLGKLYGQPVNVTGAGRTDAGVHAAGQVAHFDAPRERPAVEDIARILNRLLPNDISVKRARRVRDTFHARKSAVERTYRYRIHFGAIPDPFQAPYVWHYPPARSASLVKMRRQARRWIGTHDFARFAIRLSENERTRRHMKAIDIRRVGREILLTFRADSFLHRMVRRMVGYLVDVASGKRRSEPYYAAPASGLCLMRVSYAESSARGGF